MPLRFRGQFADQENSDRVPTTVNKTGNENATVTLISVELIHFFFLHHVLIVLIFAHLFVIFYLQILISIGTW